MDVLLKLLRKDVLYVTVNQPNEGLFESMNFVPDNIIVMSSGGVGHIALPLMAKTLSLSNLTTSEHPRHGKMGWVEHSSISLLLG